jgi:hypothetical protein
MSDRPRIVKDDRRLHQLDPLEAYGANIDFQGEPRRLAAPSPSGPRAAPVNPQNLQVLPASGTASP